MLPATCDRRGAEVCFATRRRPETRFHGESLLQDERCLFWRNRCQTKRGIGVASYRALGQVPPRLPAIFL